MSSPDGGPPELLAARVLAAPPRLGSTRLVCIDGPAGSGKTTAAAALASAVTALGAAPAVVHMDDLYAGWTLTGAVARLAAGALGPLAAGRAGSLHRYDWHAGRFGPPVPVPVADVLVVEGCGCSPRWLDPWTTLRVWVEAPEELRAQRWLDRGGAEMARYRTQWAELEAAEFAREGTRDRADVVLDGTAPFPG